MARFEVQRKPTDHGRPELGIQPPPPYPKNPHDGVHRQKKRTNAIDDIFYPVYHCRRDDNRQLNIHL